MTFVLNTFDSFDLDQTPSNVIQSHQIIGKLFDHIYLHLFLQYQYYNRFFRMGSNPIELHTE